MPVFWSFKLWCSWLVQNCFCTTSGLSLAFPLTRVPCLQTLGHSHMTFPSVPSEIRHNGSESILDFLRRLEHARGEQRYVLRRITCWPFRFSKREIVQALSFVRNRYHACNLICPKELSFLIIVHVQNKCQAGHFVCPKQISCLPFRISQKDIMLAILFLHTEICLLPLSQHFANF